MIFSWDDVEAGANLKKKGVSFEQAKTAFFDDQARVIYGGTHAKEDYFILIGLSVDLEVLVVVHIHKEYDKGEVVRIVSARRATRKESLQYRRLNGR